MRLYILLFFVLLLASCETTKPQIDNKKPIQDVVDKNSTIKQDLTVETKVIEEKINSVDDILKNIKTQTLSISKEASAIRKQTEEIAPEAARSATRIEEASGRINDRVEAVFVLNKALAISNDKISSLLKDLEENGKQLLLIKESVSKLQSDNAKVILEKEKLKKELDEVNKRITEKIKIAFYIGFCICLLIVGVGVYLAINGNLKLGVTLALSAAVTAALFYFLMAYLVYLAWCCAAVVLGSLSYIAYEKYTQNKALKETVESFEIAKKAPEWTEEVKKTISNLQSKETKKIISDIKIDAEIK